MPTVIYHYTNIEILALILKNRTLRFNRLDKVDDPEESIFISNGVNLGPYTFVSCWTEKKEESIPMWKMYTQGKWGVRLSFIKEGLFKTYCEDDGYRYNGLVTTNFGAQIKHLFPADVRYNQTKYTPPFISEDYDKCNFYRKIEYVKDVKQFAKDSVLKERSYLCVKSDQVGSYKNERWDFQEESRFVLLFMPGNPSAVFNTPGYAAEQNKMISDFVQNKDLGFSYYDMNLSDEAFDSLVITMSPLCDMPQRTIVEALKDKYAPKAKVVDSNLLGKIAK